MLEALEAVRDSEDKKSQMFGKVRATMQETQNLIMQEQDKSFLQVIGDRLAYSRAICPNKKVYAKYNGKEVVDMKMEGEFVLLETEEGCHIGHPSQMVVCIKNKSSAEAKHKK